MRDSRSNTDLFLDELCVSSNDEDCLGRGAQGTIVMRGKLGDRPVAVKKMLRHVCANEARREIDLLIESDGHPNVVRYFVTKTRGDFVCVVICSAVRIVCRRIPADGNGRASGHLISCFVHPPLA